MFDSNVLGVLRVTQALLPALERGTGGHIVVTGSIAGHLVYEGGAGYTAAKHAVTAVVETMRLELNGRPIRVTEVAPGLVRTEEFSLVRMRGDAEAAARVYAGVEHPLTADDVADCIAFAVTRPPHVNIDLLVVKPLAQAAPYKIARSRT
jgi:NADP-dependent 3-hydroxy acid dehydrogenase YdfG